MVDIGCVCFYVIIFRAVTSKKSYHLKVLNKVVDDAGSAEIYERIGTRVRQAESRRRRDYTGSGLREDKNPTSSVDVLLCGFIRMFSPCTTGGYIFILFGTALTTI